jgi:hypothetical protein
MHRGQGQHRETNNIRYTRRWTEDKDNTEKLTTYDTQDDEKQNKYTKQYVLDTTMYKQTQIT